MNWKSSKKLFWKNAYNVKCRIVARATIFSTIPYPAPLFGNVPLFGDVPLLFQLSSTLCHYSDVCRYSALCGNSMEIAHCSDLAWFYNDRHINLVSLAPMIRGLAAQLLPTMIFFVTQLFVMMHILARSLCFVFCCEPPVGFIRFCLARIPILLSSSSVCFCVVRL